MSKSYLKNLSDSNIKNYNETNLDDFDFYYENLTDDFESFARNKNYIALKYMLKKFNNISYSSVYLQAIFDKDYKMAMWIFNYCNIKTIPFWIFMNEFKSDLSKYDLFHSSMQMSTPNKKIIDHF